MSELFSLWSHQRQVSACFGNYFINGLDFTVVCLSVGKQYWKFHLDYIVHLPQTGRMRGVAEQHIFLIDNCEYLNMFLCGIIALDLFLTLVYGVT